MPSPVDGGDGGAPAASVAAATPIQPGAPASAEMEALRQQVFSGDVALQCSATEKFRKMLSKERNPPRQDVIECGVVPYFVEFLKRADLPQLQFEAAWALTNIASGARAQTATVVNAGAIPIFVDLLESPAEDVREQAVWALGNIAGDGPDCRDLVLQSGVLAPLLRLLNDNTTKVTMFRNATWVLSNLCRGKNPPPDFAVVSESLPTLAKLLGHADDEVLGDACWALSYLTDGTNGEIQKVIEAGVVGRLVELLMHDTTDIIRPALRSIGNIVTGDDVQTQAVLNCGVIPALAKLLQHTRKTIQKEVCWAISNITAGSQEQIQAVIDGNLIPTVMDKLKNSADTKTQKEALCVISNIATKGQPGQIQMIAAAGCIQPLCDILCNPEQSGEVCYDLAIKSMHGIISVALTSMEDHAASSATGASFITDNVDIIADKAAQAFAKSLHDTAIDFGQKYADVAQKHGQVVASLTEFVTQPSVANLDEATQGMLDRVDDKSAKAYMLSLCTEAELMQAKIDTSKMIAVQVANAVEAIKTVQASSNILPDISEKATELVSLFFPLQLTEPFPGIGVPELPEPPSRLFTMPPPKQAAAWEKYAAQLNQVISLVQPKVEVREACITKAYARAAKAADAQDTIVRTKGPLTEQAILQSEESRYAKQIKDLEDEHAKAVRAAAKDHEDAVAANVAAAARRKAFQERNILELRSKIEHDRQSDLEKCNIPEFEKLKASADAAARQAQLFRNVGRATRSDPDTASAGGGTFSEHLTPPHSAVRQIRLPPKEFFCPIMHEVMTDPVIAEDGVTYQRFAIEKWLSSNSTSPCHGSVLKRKAVIPNLTLKHLIADWNDDDCEDEVNGSGAATPAAPAALAADGGIFGVAAPAADSAMLAAAAGFGIAASSPLTAQSETPVQMSHSDES